jgi:membrane-associated phospholipid phosphatase
MTDSSSRRWQAVRLALGVLYVAFFVQQARAKGFPFDRERLFLWIGGALAISCLGRPWRRALDLLTDWIPLAAILVLYDFSRGLADNIGAPVRRELPIRVEKFLFLGDLPTEFLQKHFFPSGTSISWWEVGVSIIYASHFFVPFLTAGILWARSRNEWRRWVNRFLLISLGGLLTYAVLPVAPPWMSSRDGLLPPLERPIGRGWGRVHFEAATKLLDEGRAVLNPVAAVPSLHAAYSMLLVTFLWKRVQQPVLRWAMLSYPLAMSFALVYGAEHYVVDVLIGWLYVWFAFVIARRLEAWWTLRRLNTSAQGGI